MDHHKLEDLRSLDGVDALCLNRATRPPGISETRLFIHPTWHDDLTISCWVHSIELLGREASARRQPPPPRREQIYSTFSRRSFPLPQIRSAHRAHPETNELVSDHGWVGSTCSDIYVYIAVDAVLQAQLNTRRTAHYHPQEQGQVARDACALPVSSRFCLAATGRPI